VPGDSPAQLLDLPERCDAQGRLQLRDPSAAVDHVGAVMTVERELPVLDVEFVVDLDALAEQPLQHPPVLREQVSCRCGKRTLAAHGGFSCDEVLAMGARVAYSALPFWRRWRAPKPAGWRLSREELVALQDRGRHVEPGVSR
jgi:hypothetical protein